MLTIIIIIVVLYITIDWIKNQGKYDKNSSLDAFKRLYSKR